MYMELAFRTMILRRLHSTSILCLHRHPGMKEAPGARQRGIRPWNIHHRLLRTKPISSGPCTHVGSVGPFGPSMGTTLRPMYIPY